MPQPDSIQYVEDCTAEIVEATGRILASMTRTSRGEPFDFRKAAIDVFRELTEGVARGVAAARAALKQHPPVDRPAPASRQAEAIETIQPLDITNTYDLKEVERRIHEMGAALGIPKHLLDTIEFASADAKERVRIRHYYIDDDCKRKLCDGEHLGFLTGVDSRDVLSGMKRPTLDDCMHCRAKLPALLRNKGMPKALGDPCPRCAEDNIKDDCADCYGTGFVCVPDDDA